MFREVTSRTSRGLVSLSAKEKRKHSVGTGNDMADDQLAGAPPVTAVGAPIPANPIVFGSGHSYPADASR